MLVRFRPRRLFSCVAGVVLAMLPVAASPAAEDPDPRVRDAELRLRLEIEQSAARIQREVSSRVNSVMSTRPATSFRLRNAVQAASNSINSVTRREIARIGALVSGVVDELAKRGVAIVDVSQLADAFDTEVADQLNALSGQGVRDVAGLVGRNGRRIVSARGTASGRYTLSVSKPEDGRAPVELGIVDLGESQMIRGAISTAAAEKFFLAPLGPRPTPLVVVPPATVLRAVRWLNRGGAMTITADDSRGETVVGVDQARFSVKGVDLLPERLRVALERRLAESPDVRSNAEGADGFFRSVTYTFERVPVTAQP